MELNLIYARARNGVIGKNGKLPWTISEDMAHFRALTLGNVVIMGRKTFESLPGPLGGRINIVVTRNPSLPLPGINVYRAASVKEALAIAQRLVDMKYAREIWVIGGAEIYKETLPLATNVWVTEIDADFDGDAKMPPLSPLDWKEESRRRQSTSAGIALHFVHYVRRKTHLCWRRILQSPQAAFFCGSWLCSLSRGRQQFSAPSTSSPTTPCLSCTRCWRHLAQSC